MTKTLKSFVATAGVLFFATVAFATLKLSTAKRKDADVVLSEKNTVVLRDEVTDESVGKCIKKLQSLDTEKEAGSPIYLVLDTPGGSIQAGIELMEAVKGLRRPVNTVTIFAASMGFQIAQNLDDRLILSGGVLMSHKARGAAQGEFSPASDSQLDKRLNFWKSRLLEMDKKTVERTKGKQTLQSYQAAYENELWLSGSDAVAQGYADKVVSVRCDESLKGSEEIIVPWVFGLKFKVRLSKCPLQSAPESVQTAVETNRGEMKMEDFLAEGGILGIDCAIAQSRVSPVNGKVLCASNSSLTKEVVDQERQKISMPQKLRSKNSIKYSW